VGCVVAVCSGANEELVRGLGTDEVRFLESDFFFPFRPQEDV
jgi:hypothetical protein